LRDKALDIAKLLALGAASLFLSIQQHLGLKKKDSPHWARHHVHPRLVIIKI